MPPEATLIFPFLLLPFIGFALGILLQHRAVMRGMKSQKKWKEMVDDLLAVNERNLTTIKSLTASLNKGTELVNGLLDEKKAAWGLSASYKVQNAAPFKIGEREDAT